MKIKSDEITTILKEEILRYAEALAVEEVGTVLEVGDGIARIHGLSECMAMELVEFENGVMGMALNLEEKSIGAVILGDYLSLREGSSVKRTRRVMEVPCGPALIGRVVDVLGNPIDGKGPIHAEATRPLEFKAPGIARRQPVNVPLQTGLKAIDSMTPIGRGQRELIIGDRGTGKTAIAIDTIINQKGKQVICVYVAVGQKGSTVAGVVDRLRAAGAMDYSIVVAAPASTPAPMQFIAPYAGCAMAEYFMFAEGRDTLCVYDDLSKQAAAYRQVALLLRRPPGREAYPGDVFYLHSRLLERAVKMREEYVICRKDASAPTGASSSPIKVGVDGKVYHRPHGRHEAQEKLKTLPDAAALEVRQIPGTGGSLTALPIIETQEGEVSAYIPTNVISITDGQIYLQPELFFSGVRPAVDVGISVSRVGGNAQTKAMKEVSGGLKLDLAQYRELEAFAQLGTELDATSTRQIERGKRMIEVLKQDQYRPLEMEDQVIIIHAGTKGFLDALPVAEVRAFEKRFLEFIHASHSEIPQGIAKEKKLTDELKRQLEALLKSSTEAWKQGKNPDPRAH